ncbi:MAG: penicillin-binding protein activator [Proteobacteria bacterium]|nr:penicillin-binding protein activator [Pseudomonadota bacterium]
MLVILAGCATPAPPERAASDEERLTLEAALARGQTRPAAAEAELQEFLQRWPQSPLADDAALGLAKLAFQMDEPEQAQHWLRTILRRYPDGDRADEARLLMAAVELERGQDAEVRRLLSNLRFSRLDLDQQRAGYRMLVKASSDPVQRVRWLAPVRAVALRAADSEEVARADREIDSLLSGMSVADLDRTAEQLDRRIPASRVRLQLAMRAIDAGDFAAAGKYISRASRLELAPEYRDSLEQARLHLELRKRMGDADDLPAFAEVAALPPPRTQGATGTLGVVLPLTGPFARFGEQSLRGVLLAARVFDETGRVLSMKSVSASAPVSGAEFTPGAGRPGRIRVVVRDTGGTPEGAATAIRELARDRSVIAIVGPLLSAESEAAAEAASHFDVPLLTLTSREEVSRDRRHVFRLRTTPSDEVRYLVDHAVEDLGATRFAILYPRDNYGRGMRDQFWQAVEKRGGYVVAASSYEASATDFAQPIRQMIGYPLLTEDEKTALEERDAVLRRARRLDPEEAGVAREEAYAKLGPEGDPLPPIVDFDALFIPDSHDKIVLITPQLAFHEITGVQLLGSGAWLHEDLLKIARKHVRGAVISAPFHAESRFVFVSRFVERYSTAFGETPDRFAAQGFDAANLILVQLAGGRLGREEIRDGLLRVRAYPGVSGVTTIQPDGNARKRPYLLGIRGGRIVSLD